MQIKAIAPSKLPQAFHSVFTFSQTPLQYHTELSTMSITLV